MSPWSATTLARINAPYDADTATDVVSRYDAYLAQHPDWFHEFDEPGTPLGPAAFAAAAWRVATGPVMSPGYVRFRPDIAAIEVHESEELPSGLALSITVPLSHQALAHRPGAGWRDWEPDQYDHGHGAFCRLAAPADAQPAVLPSAVIRIPVQSRWLPRSTSVSGPGLTADAKAAVASLTRLVNTSAGRAVAEVQGHALVYA
jgi:hypothetical protein